MNQLLKNLYIEFQSLESIQDKIQYLNKNADNLEIDFNINVQNLISAWTKKL
jgi:uncharacterized lipoprotein YehR (DUF1307 family)